MLSEVPKDDVEEVPRNIDDMLCADGQSRVVKMAYPGYAKLFKILTFSRKMFLIVRC